MTNNNKIMNETKIRDIAIPSDIQISNVTITYDSEDKVNDCISTKELLRDKIKL